jgi:hypothetical protein
MAAGSRSAMGIRMGGRIQWGIEPRSKAQHNLIAVTLFRIEFYEISILSDYER